MILGVIPARAGSKRIPNKNIYRLCGKPLIDYTIEATAQSKLEDFVITSDIDINRLLELQNLVKRQHSIRDITISHWQKRPKYLSRDSTASIDTIKYSIQKYERNNFLKVTAVCLLQPTSPLRNSEDIDRCLDKFRKYRRSIYTGFHIILKHKNKLFNKHDTPHFQRNGAIFISPRELIFEKNQLWDDDVIEVEMPYIRSIDIDDMNDMATAHSLIKGGIT